MAIVNQNFSDVFEIITRKFILLFSLPFIIFIVIPSLIALAPPLFLIRRFVSLLGRRLRTDLGKIVSPGSTVIAVIDNWDKPYFNIVLNARFKDPINIDELKSKVFNKVIEIKDVRGELKNIALKQYPYKWMGFLFWKWDDSFDISNHVKYYEPEANSDSKISLKKIYEIENDLMFKAFPEKRSPWECVVVRNVESKNGEDYESVMFVRFHHSVADGFSAMKLICLEIFDEVAKENIPQIVFPKLNFFQKLMFRVRFLKVPYEMAESISNFYYSDEWKISHRKMSDKWISAVSDKICVDEMKEAARGLNSNVTAVILAAMTAAIQKSMKKQNFNLPNYAITGLPIPMKNHPDKLTNYASVVLLKLPVREPDPLKRLKYIERSIEKVKNSAFPLVYHWIATVSGWMCCWMIDLFANGKTITCTALTSSFPGPKTKLTLLGNEMVDAHFGLGPLLGICTVCVNTLTYNNFFTLRLMLNEKIMKDQADVDEMAKHFLEEFYVLKKYSNDIV